VAKLRAWGTTRFLVVFWPPRFLCRRGQPSTLIPSSLLGERTANSRVSAALSLLILAGFACMAWGQKYHPDHPVVQEMVSRGVSYLRTAKPTMSSVNGDLGNQLLIAYTIYKVEGDPEDPLVAAAILAAKNCIESNAGSTQHPHKAIYELSIACMLLASVDAEEYRGQLAKARDFFFKVQSTTGGFVYIDGSHKNSISDISQTQYVVLALWTMSQVGIEVPQDGVIRIVQYLLDAQLKDPSAPNSTGGWPYQWDRGTSVMDKTTSHSRVACGLSALLISTDTLGLYRSRVAQSSEEEELIPTAFKRVLSEIDKSKRANFDRSKIDAAVNLALQYNKTHPYTRQIWHYYYVYSVERFESFLEIANGKQNKSPDWYNVEVERLRSLQGQNGEWGGNNSPDYDSVLPPDVASCFAVLFLIRSTQKAIGDLKEGMVRGWAELPSDISSITLVNGKPMNTNEATSIDDALKMLEDDKKLQGEDKLISEKFVFSKNPEQRKDQLNRFARLLRSRDYQARRISAKVLGRSDELDVVPELIYALSDPDSVVCRTAETSLRLLSRQLDRYHLPKEGAISEQDRIIAKREWRSWFLSMRPDYIFVE
jgi:hypothetical protein